MLAADAVEAVVREGQAVGDVAANVDARAAFEVHIDPIGRRDGAAAEVQATWEGHAHLRVPGVQGATARRIAFGNRSSQRKAAADRRATKANSVPCGPSACARYRPLGPSRSVRPSPTG